MTCRTDTLIQLARVIAQSILRGISFLSCSLFLFQFAVKMGYRVFALSRGKDKEALALKLGAHKYFDTNDPKFVESINVSRCPEAHIVAPLFILYSCTQYA